MDLSTITYIILSGMGAMGAFICKSIISRVENLEGHMLTKITEPEVRQILSDRLEPINDNIKDIKDKIDRMLDLYIELSKHGSQFRKGTTNDF